MKARWWSFRFLAACAFSALQGISGAADKPAGEPAPPEVIAEFDIAKGGDVIILPVTIADQTYPFLLSLVSQRTVADSRLRPLLGKRIEPNEGAERIAPTADEYPAIPMQIGKLTFTPEKPIVCLSLKSWQEAVGHDVYGVLGHDCLKERIVEIDFDVGKVRVLASFPRPIPREAGSAILWKHENRPVLSLDIAGTAVYLPVDTTFLGPVTVRTTVMNDLMEKGLVAHVQEADLLRSGDGTTPRKGLLKRPMLDKWTFKDLSVVEDAHDRIGLAVLSRFKLVFDFRMDWVLLTPGARFGQPEEFNWSGMDLLLKNGDVIVVNVGKNGPAARAGIQPGDVLVEANGKPAREWSLFEVRRLFMEQKTVRARFHRPERESHGAEEFTISFENPKITISQKEIIPTGGTDDSKP
jgi:hypothetical protein